MLSASTEKNKLKFLERFTSQLIIISFINNLKFNFDSLKNINCLCLNRNII